MTLYSLSMPESHVSLRLTVSQHDPESEALLWTSTVIYYLQLRFSYSPSQMSSVKKGLLYFELDLNMSACPGLLHILTVKSVSGNIPR